MCWDSPIILRRPAPCKPIRPMFRTGQQGRWGDQGIPPAAHLARLFLDANVLLSGLRAYRGLAQALGMTDRWYTARMAAKKKTSKKQAKRIAGKKVKPIKNAFTAKLATKAATSKKKLAQKNSAPKNAVAKTKAGARKIALGKTARAAKKRVRGKSKTVDTVVLVPTGLPARTARH